MIQESERLKGKVALVTGAGQGIGRAIAKTFAGKGALVVIADIDESNGESVAREICESSGSARYMKTDLSRETDIEKMVMFTVENFGRLDIVINNARPKLSPLPFAESLEEWDLAMDVFLKAPALIAKYALPHFKNSGGGNIINIASVNAFFIAPHQPVSYHIAKAGLVQLTRYLAVEFGPHNIRVNTICPGLVDIQDRGQPLTADPVNRAVTEAVVPLGRATSPEEIAGLAVFLCTDAAAYMTGQVLMLDGGEMLIDQFHAARKAYNQGRETQGRED